MPQWNCSCPNCQAARQGKIPHRTQSCIAIAIDPDRWFLVNASPDLARQIESFARIQPRATSARNSPIRGVLLTNADLDHLLGLFLLREGEKFTVHAPLAVQNVAQEILGVQGVLGAFSGSKWVEPPFDDFEPLDKEASSRLLYRAIALEGKPPPFASGFAEAGIHSVAYEFVDQRTHGRLLVAPDVAGINKSLQRALNTSAVVLFDGTFWSNDELAQVRPGARPASDMGHLTIRDSSLDLLAGLRAAKKIYVHINNTNPILAPGSPERAAVEAAGILIGHDGLEFDL